MSNWKDPNNKWNKKHYFDEETQTESPMEKRFFLYCQKEGLELLTQVEEPPYRLDFLVRNTKIVVEIDGKNYHSSKAQISYDLARQRFLQRKGYTVIRFSGDEIYNKLKQCYDELMEFILINNGTIQNLMD